MNKKNNIVRSLFGLLAAAVLTIGASVTPMATGDLPDPATTGSITVHKYSTASPSVRPGTGLPLTGPDAASLGTPLAGVGFSLYKVNNGFTVTNATTVAQAKANATIVESEKLTDASGNAVWSNLTLGYYVLSETTPPDAGKYTPAVDSIITFPMGITADGTGWNYNVHVYPKNVKTSIISKEVTTVGPQYNVGDTVSWKIDGVLPAGLRTGVGPYTYGSFAIEDPLDARLTFTPNSDVVSAMGGAAAPLVLTRVTDYTVAVDGTNKVVWTLTNAGIDKIAVDGSQSLSIAFNTTINTKATDGTPTGSPGITNGAQADWTNSGGTTGSAAIPTDEQPTIDLAGIVISKVDSVTNTILLDGAQFKIALTAANAQAGTYVKSGTTPANDLIVTTGDDASTVAVEKGWAMFTGLPLNAAAETKFYLVEVTAPTGYVRRQSIIEVTVPNGSKKVTVTVLNQKIGDPPIDETNPSFQLPQTGGMGTVIFTVVGVVLISGAIFILFKNRRKDEKN